MTLPSEHSPLRIPLSLCHNAVFYLYKMVSSANLTSHYPLPPAFDLSQPALLAGLIGTVLLVVVLLVSSRWTPALIVGYAMFFVALLPTTQIVGFTHVIASDKYAYFPALGILLALCWVMTRVWSPPDAPRRRIYRAGLVALVVAAAALETRATRAYLAEWRDTETLYRRMVRLAPEAPGLYGHLGNHVLEQGRVDEAVALQLEAVRHAKWEPWVPLNDLGNALYRGGRVEEAVHLYNDSLKLKPDFAAAHGNLGMAYASLNQRADAKTHLAEALRLDPRSGEAHYNLGTILLSEGRADDAIRELQEAVRLKPNHAPAWNNLAILMAQSGKVDQAIRNFRRSIAVNPNYTEAHFNLARTLEQQYRYAEATDAYRQVLRIKPGDQDARAALESLRSRQALPGPP